jgi:hypothetical protein
MEKLLQNNANAYCTHRLNFPTLHRRRFLLWLIQTNTYTHMWRLFQSAGFQPALIITFYTRDCVYYHLFHEMHLESLSAR